MAKGITYSDMNLMRNGIYSGVKHMPNGQRFKFFRRGPEPGQTWSDLAQMETEALKKAELFASSTRVRRNES